MQIFNFGLLLTGISILTSSIFLSFEIGGVNNLTLSILLTSIFMLFTSIFGILSTNKSPCANLIYQFFTLILLLLGLTISFYIIFDEQYLIDFLTANMTDSIESINRIKVALNHNMDITKIALLIYAFIGVI
jgi:hypothetical protein